MSDYKLREMFRNTAERIAYDSGEHYMSDEDITDAICGAMMYAYETGQLHERRYGGTK